MKIFLTIFFLFFSSLLFADDISDFEIEGFSIGDSLLDFYTKDQIANNRMNYLDDREYYVVNSGNLKLKKFDSIEFYLKTSDSNFIIRHLGGFIFYQDGMKNMTNCEKLRDEYSIEVEKILNNPNKIDEGRYSHYFDKSGKSIQSRINFSIGIDYISIECLDWSEDIHKNYPGWTDNLSFLIGKNEIQRWIENDYK